ncbi:MAG: Rne/Rng family ribonuclease [Lentisphaerae bacterium]|jgi:Rne/Rng family ribonuclease|nr:Rne/Rng family ribonuclease [Lentisphaerota bacterium]
MKQILINDEDLQTRVAVVHDGVLQDFYMERKSRDRLVGSIYKARIKNLEPSLQAAFVDIGCGKNAFLHYWDMLPATQDMLESSDDNADNGGQGAAGKASPEELHSRAPGRSVSKQSQSRRTAGSNNQRYNKNRASTPQKTSDKDNEQPPQPQPAKTVPQKGKKSLIERVRDLLMGTGKAAPTKTPPAPPPPAPSKAPASTPTAPEERHPGRHAPRGQRNSGRSRQAKNMPSVDDIPNLFKADQEILVQVTKGPIGTKGSRVTANLSIPGRYLVLLPNSNHIGISKRVEQREERDRLRKMIRSLELPPNMGLICRTVGAGRKLEHFQRDLDLLLDYWRKGEIAGQRRAPVCVYQEPDLGERALRDCLTEDVDEVIIDSEEMYNRARELITRYNLQDKTKVKFYQNPTPIFAKHNLINQIDGIFNRKVPLPSGGYICIDETEAMIAIDVNTGKSHSGKDQPETILATNLEAVREIARQLRLRNIGGLVVLDLIDMRSKKDQQTVFNTFKDLLEEDRARTKIYPISPLGLLEMTRQRENESVESTIFDNCPYCKGRGLVKTTTSMSVEIQRRLNEVLGRRKHGQKINVLAHPKIVERLKNEDRKLFAAIESDYKATFTYQPEPSFHLEDFKLQDAQTGQDI